MKEFETTPSQLLEHIASIIRDREGKTLPTYYSISIEQYGTITPLVEREEGHENFKAQVLKFNSDYNPTSLIIQLFNGKSRKVKQPFQTFKVPVKKMNVPIVLGGLDKHEEPEQKITPVDSSIPVGRYYDEKFEMQMRIMRTEMEKQTLGDRIHQLTERYEDKIKEIEKKHEERVKDLQEEIENLEEDISDFEKEIAKNEKEKSNSFGNIALGSISARAIEGFAKSDFGIGVLKGLLGKDGYSNLQGHLAGIEAEQQNTASEEQSSVRIITQTNTNDPRQIALAYIQKVAQAFNDTYLRMLYDITEMSEKNSEDLQVLWNVSKQITERRNKTIQPKKENVNDTDEKKHSEKEEEEETEEESDGDTNTKQE